MTLEQHETEVARYLALLGLNDARKGSRRLLGDGIEPDGWEDYNEIPNEAIVRAMNCHDELVAALITLTAQAKDTSAYEDALNGHDDYFLKAVSDAESIIAKVRQ